jgi:hypothetical protein
MTNMIYLVESVTSPDVFTVKQHADPITGTLTPISGTYTGLGTMSRVSQISIDTKHFNFYLKDGMNIYCPTVEFYVDRTANGQITIDVSTSASSASLKTDGAASGALMGTNVLETFAYPTIPYEATQARFWHRFYPQATGETIQLKLYLSDAQMIDPRISSSLFELNAMVFYTQTVTR